MAHDTQDAPLAAAAAQIKAAQLHEGARTSPVIQAFFDPATYTVS